MPSVSTKQHNFMAAVANNPAFAKKAGVPQSVGQDFTKADKGRKFSKGGDMATRKPFPKGLFKGKESMAEELKEAKAIKSGKISPMQYAKGEKSEPTKKMATGGRLERIENLRNFGRRQTTYPAGVTRRQGPSSGTSTRPASASPTSPVGPGGPKDAPRTSLVSEVGSPRSKTYSDPTPEQIKQMIAMKTVGSPNPDKVKEMIGSQTPIQVQKPIGSEPAVPPPSNAKMLPEDYGKIFGKTYEGPTPMPIMTDPSAKPVMPDPAEMARKAAANPNPIAGNKNAMAAQAATQTAGVGMARGGGVEARGKTKGKAVKMARGGGVESRGKTKGTIVKMARGGGIESRGKTRGTMVKMMKGGKC